ncbi:HD domain-containing phosphohydrolase [Glaciecola sp. 2405UD65-10]|uniref:HD domain-containing phosphohydrolase n=1 Tax=Glaciecola sp. 2405UD65-10 TaxID=3397244 RepID=UPI003B5B2B5A
MPEKKQFTVLFLDDEPNILRAMKRLFHGRQNRLVLVDDGNKALDFMKNNEIHVVVCDMKMPAMNGEAFLEQVAQLYPDTYRIVLSGYADADRLLNAVNKGRIHRYIQKPWSNEALIAAIEDGTNNFRLKFENDDLQKKVSEQNRRLSLLNSSLEERVELRTVQMKTAIKRADMQGIATKKVLCNALNSLPFVDVNFGKRVSQLAVKMAHALQLDAKEIEDIKFAGLIAELGFVGLNENIYTNAYTKMTPKQQSEYNNQGNIALLILSPAIHLKPICEMLVNQFEFVDGSGHPKGLKKKEIPIGAQIIGTVRDYYRLTLGRYDGEKYSNKVAIGKLNQFAGLHYSKQVLSALEGVMLVENSASQSEGLSTRDLANGMTLTEAIYNEKDILVMPQGQTLDESAIAKLKALEERNSFSLTIFAK